MSLLDSEEILDNNADLAVLNDHANYRGIIQGLPIFDECKFGDMFWVLDEGKLYIKDFENWRAIPDMTPLGIFQTTIAECGLIDQGPKNHRIKLNNPQTITDIDKLYHGGYGNDISIVKINYSNEII